MQTRWMVLVVLVQILTHLCQVASGLCNFVDLVASCDMTLGGVPVTAYARVNHCHNPVDVTFQVLGKDPSEVSWRYTYVTTNLAENVVLSKHIILAMVASQKEDGRRINIQARFLLDGNGSTDLEFLNTDLTLPIPQKNCVTLRSSGGPGWVAGACLLGLAVAALVVTLAVIKSRTGARIPGHRIPARLWRRFAHHRSNTGGSTVVQYVVPADTPADLKVYISTADGLQPVHNNNTAELQLQPHNLTATAKSDNSSTTAKLDRTKNGKSQKDKSELTNDMQGIANTAFEWDEDETEGDKASADVSETKTANDGAMSSNSDANLDDTGLATGARPKQRTN
eukprot:TRINITY_DN4264_c0_g2_i1.p1 TRINITY_DN4264_c0_g2~~TRINITY_DN4264_c0_g2_i1.p1  ORF type:complete len:339 (+),score=79.02 TRINITY_DN4264_c0_g2_i1:267-1283(+)